jgi:urease accessory protein
MEGGSTGICTKAIEDVAPGLVDCTYDAPGSGRLGFSLVAGRTAVTRLRSASPLKLLTPRHGGRGAWAFASTYGGGLVSGDAIRLEIQAGPGSLSLLGTQASTKIYRAAEPSAVCRQTMDVRIGREAVFVSMPDPVVCFAGASYSQRQRFDLDEAAALVLVDWFTSGRSAAGERWAFARYESRTDVRVAGRLVLRDAMLLDPVDGPIAAPHRAGQFDCFATAVLIGDRLKDAGRKVLERIGSMPIHQGTSSPRSGIIFSASPLAAGCGTVMRAAGQGVEPVGRWLREQLAIVPELFDEDPWRRKT